MHAERFGQQLFRTVIPSFHFAANTFVFEFSRSLVELLIYHSRRRFANDSLGEFNYFDRLLP